MIRPINNPGPSQATRGGLYRRMLGCAITGVAASAWLSIAQAQPRAEVRIDNLAAEEEGVGPEDMVDEGFGFSRVDEDTEEELAGFFEALDQGAWEKAFKSYAAYREPTRDRLSPAGDDGLLQPIERVITRKLRELPPEGRAAFELYFDAYARELLAGVEEHPRPGSAEQLRAAEELYNWFLMTSSGPRACDLLGDLYFEVGRFADAEQCWATLLEVHPGARPEVVIQSKRCIALMRAGQVEAAERLASGLVERFGDQAIEIAGMPRPVGPYLTALLAEQSEPAAAQADHAVVANGDHRYVPTGLPKAGTEPRWCFTIVNEANQKRMELASNSRRVYMYNTSLNSLVPPVTTDDQRLYGQWMGSVFALDLATGKLLWRTQPFSTATQSVGYRNTYNSNTDDYAIALSDRHVLVVDAVLSDRSGSYTLTAYDKQTGQPAWDTVSSLFEHSVCGKPLVHSGSAYLTTRPRNAAAGELTLHRLSATDGSIVWSVPLGDLDLRPSPYSNQVPTVQPVLYAQDRQLFVLTNNGGMVALDLAFGQIQWARSLQTPVHLRMQEQHHFARFPDEESIPDARPGGMILLDGTLYAKESLSEQLYALDPRTGALQWQRSAESLYAELAAADGDELVLISSDIEVHSIDDDRNGQARVLGANKFGPPASNLILADQTLYMLANGKVQAVPMDRPRSVQSFTSPHLQQNEGGRLVTAPGLLICVTRTGLTAFPVPTRPATDLQ